MRLFYLLRLTNRRVWYFIFIVLLWNVFQLWLTKHSYIFHRLNWNNGNAPSYIRWSLDTLEQCLGAAVVYPPGQSWFRFPYGRIYTLIAVFWLIIWYILACALDVLQKASYCNEKHK